MREILFRGKRKDTGEWVEAFSVAKFKVDDEWVTLVGASQSALMELDVHYNLASAKSLRDFLFYSVHPETIGQFTGLTDRKGKKIFEGDIVMGAYKGKGVVEFTTENVASCGCCFPYFAGSGFKADDVNLGDCEVIGNIHDNPKLQEASDGKETN